MAEDEWKNLGLPEDDKRKKVPKKVVEKVPEKAK
jgi:hypothetical protein